MWNSIRGVWGALLVITMLLSCAPAGPTTSAPARISARRLGTVTEYDVRTRLRDLLQRHHFIVLRYQGPPEIYIETEWRSRYPFEDERALGVEAAQTRLLFRARRAPYKGTYQELYDLQLTVENQTRTSTGQWTNTITSAQFLEYARRIGDDIETEFRGNRRYGSGASPSARRNHATD